MFFMQIYQPLLVDIREIVLIGNRSDGYVGE